MLTLLLAVVLHLLPPAGSMIVVRRGSADKQNQVIVCVCLWAEMRLTFVAKVWCCGCGLLLALVVLALVVVVVVVRRRRISYRHIPKRQSSIDNQRLIIFGLFASIVT
jgi:hypothetical protein